MDLKPQKIDGLQKPTIILMEQHKVMDINLLKLFTKLIIILKTKTKTKMKQILLKSG